jgi:hypothetical protein
MNFLKLMNAVKAQGNDVLLANLWGLSGAGANLSVGLYNTSYVPVDSDVVSTYTGMECSFPGYARITTVAGDWSPSVVVSNVGLSVGKTCTYVRSAGAGSPETAYGMFLFHPVSLILIYAQLFDVAIVITNPGDSVVFSLQYGTASLH